MIYLCTVHIIIILVSLKSWIKINSQSEILAVSDSEITYSLDLSMGLKLCQKLIDCFVLCRTFICPWQQSVPCSGKLVCLCVCSLFMSGCSVILLCCPYSCSVLSSLLLSCHNYCHPNCYLALLSLLSSCSVVQTVNYKRVFWISWLIILQPLKTYVLYPICKLGMLSLSFITYQRQLRRFTALLVLGLMG